MATPNEQNYWVDADVEALAERLVDDSLAQGQSPIRVSALERQRYVRRAALALQQTLEDEGAQVDADLIRLAEQLRLKERED